MPALNEINKAAKLHAEREYQKRLERQKAEFNAAMASAGMFFVTVVVTLIAVCCVYHGGIGWLL